MENFTNIENDFNSRISPEIDKLMQNQSLVQNPTALQNRINELIRNVLFLMRQEKIQSLCKKTGRNTICYISAWLQSSSGNPEMFITDNDMNGFMNSISGMDEKSKGLDLILHTPGGGVTATESIVNYLRKVFNKDIRVIVPHLAMSAGTMIACSSKEIVMGKESSLGPIDPQYRGVPAQGVLNEFESAMSDIGLSPNKALIWKEIIQQYRPTFLGECNNVVHMSRELVKGWMMDCMFKDCANKEEIVNRIMSELNDHEVSKVHDRHYDYIKCQKLGLNVSTLEEDQEFQDIVLGIHHCYLLSIYKLPNTLKYIENQNGQTFVVSGKR